MASQEFKDAICDAGTPVADCEYCGRTYFAGNDSYMEKGEYAELKRKQLVNPLKYIEIGDMDAISFGHIAGKQFVWHCDCKGLDQFERFIVGNTHVIVKFLKARAESLKKKAEADSALVEGLEAKP